MTKIVLSDNVEYFISLTKEGEHSFVTLGVHDYNHETTHTLAYFGKKLRRPEDYGCQGRVNSVFNTCDGVLTQDYKFKKAKKDKADLEFEYKAFNISYNDYLNFINEINLLLEGKYADFSDEEKELYNTQVYYPYAAKPNEFGLTDINLIPSQGVSHYSGQIIEELNIRNNCRHTTVSMIESFLPERKEITSGISSWNAYQNLPYKATYNSDKVKGNFYILPIPPDFTNRNNARNYALITLYEKLENIPKRNPESAATKEKFNALKDIYNELNAKNVAQSSTDDLLQRIMTWENRNKTIIDKHRYIQLFGMRTDTRVMLDELIEDLSPPRSCC